MSIQMPVLCWQPSLQESSDDPEKNIPHTRLNLRLRLSASAVASPCSHDPPNVPAALPKAQHQDLDLTRCRFRCLSFAGNPHYKSPLMILRKTSHTRDSTYAFA
uniref:Uncharacterized protein n=1 Tax=Guillardia theta TaxID=55529 RepID=A0A7S4KW15_GUITH